MNEIIHGDCVQLMSTMESNSVDLVVTSPPYDNLRSYHGYSFDFEAVASQLYRIVKKGGVVVWVVKDSIVNGNKSLTSFRQAIRFQEIGFNVYDVILYAKTSGLLPHTGRYRDAFEYCFVLSNGKPKTINLIADRPNKSAGRVSGAKTVREQDGTLSPRKSKAIPEFGVRTNIWEYATGKGVGQTDEIAYQHPATFPEKLAEDHILSWSNPGDLVLDPMCGSGTTCKMALKNGRKFIGMDISEKYCEIARRRING